MAPKKKAKKLKKSAKKRIGPSYEIGNEVLMVKNFNHLLGGGDNCQLSSLRKVLAHHNLNLSENMLLGIASGLHFIYWAMKLMPPFVGGLNGKDITLFENILSRLGGSAKVLKTGSLKVSYKQFKEHLRQGEPLISFVDMAYLTYFYSEDTPYPMEENHFGGHTMVVYGVDEPKNIVYVSDHFQTPSTLTIQHYMDAHSSKHPPFGAKNLKLQFDFPKKFPENLEPIIIEAIRENGNLLQNAPIKNLGLKGMLKFKDMVATWPKTYKGENLLMSLVMTFIYNQTGGTGGALFRNMYTKFLLEAYKLTEKEILKEAAEIYRQAATAWDNVSVRLLPDELPALKEMRLAFLESSKVQKEAAPGYQKKLREIDDGWKSKKKEALKEIKDFQTYIPALQDAIQEAHDLEAQAWVVLNKL